MYLGVFLSVSHQPGPSEASLDIETEGEDTSTNVSACIVAVDILYQ